VVCVRVYVLQGPEPGEALLRRRVVAEHWRYRRVCSLQPSQ
jgi:hypothetical protein